MTEPTRINIITQGSPRVNAEGAHVYRRGNGIALVLADLASKRCRVWGTLYGEDAAPQIEIEAGEEGLHLDGSKPRDAATVIELPDFAGWDVWMTEVCKYTLSVCLVKAEERGEK